MDYVEKLKLRTRVGDLDLPKIRKRYSSSLKGGRGPIHVPAWHNNREQDSGRRIRWNTQGGMGCVRG